MGVKVPISECNINLESDEHCALKVNELETKNEQSIRIWQKFLNISKPAALEGFSKSIVINIKQIGPKKKR